MSSRPKSRDLQLLFPSSPFPNPCPPDNPNPLSSRLRKPLSSRQPKPVVLPTPQTLVLPTPQTLVLPTPQTHVIPTEVEGSAVAFHLFALPKPVVLPTTQTRCPPDSPNPCPPDSPRASAWGNPTNSPKSCSPLHSTAPYAQSSLAPRFSVGNRCPTTPEVP